MDDISVLLMIFTSFAVPPAFRKRGLMIGIIGAFLVITGLRMWWGRARNPTSRATRR